MSLLAVRRCLEEALEAMEGPIATAWENVPFTPVDGTPYQRVFLLAAEPDNPEMGRFTQERGFMQISLAYPLGEGPGAALARAELIRSTFKRGSTFAASGITTTIEKTPEISPALIEDDRYVVPVRVRFFANYAAV